MEGISLEFEDVYLEEINENDADRIYSWYSKEYGYAHATGLNTGICRKDFDSMWQKAGLKEDEFFLSIYSKESREVLGFIKGIIPKNEPSTIFITALAVNTDMRRRKIGTKALNALLLGFKQHKSCDAVFVSVDFDNKIGLKFWRNNKFKVIKIFRKKLLTGNSNILVNLMKREF